MIVFLLTIIFLIYFLILYSYYILLLSLIQCLLLYSVFLSDYPWRTAVHPLTSNVIKWFYFPDFAREPDPSFIFCEFIFALFGLDFEPVPHHVRF